ncbi:sensor domain-containing diguanylate cyclase [Paenibacillus athensensis]|uniref:Diguanylate cyclase n=1 Tax=Paenibacillus athensensis TaxID=1967502 RepID=A0A4Y8Q2E4_9BACL|nr:sensor domain-containing diguanylate cyclase [Paenibacillus athensensis]MCD1258690.1 sensor domain-containing diguanylate cyclase [Paenibacillus athensensis]
MYRGEALPLNNAVESESATFFGQIVQQSWELFSVLGLDGELLHVSASCQRTLGAILPTSRAFLERVHEEDRQLLRQLFWATAQGGGGGTLDFRVQHMNGEWLWLESRLIAIYSPTGELRQVVFVARDITARKQQEARLLNMAYHDPLTGLPNRRLFREHLNQALLQAKRSGGTMALLYLDIDDFKIINDTMGHDTGDAFLQVFAERVRGALREIDTCARMGGDEFTILLPVVDEPANVETVARRIFQSLQRPWDVGEYQFTATVSMGIAVYPNDGKDAASLLKHVDSALYQVKGHGRNGYQFYRAQTYEKPDNAG